MHMNRTQAMFILGACPPGPWPTDDAQVAEALAFAESDPELQAWLAETRTFDAAMAERLLSIEPPADLLDLILAGRRATPTPVQPRRWPMRTVLALAATIALLITVPAAWINWSPKTDAAALRRDAAIFLSEKWQHDFDYPESSFPKIQEWAAQQSFHAQLEAPAGLAKSRTYGCKVFKWRGHTAALVCFVPEGKGQVVHIISVDRSALPTDGSTSPEQRQLAKAGEWNTATWHQDGRSYVALTQLAPETLSQILAVKSL